MRISYNWLKQFIHIEETPEKLGEILTNAGLEVESIDKHESIKGGLEQVVIAQVITCNPHPNADKLKVTTIDAGEGVILPVVCGAPNVAAGQKVILAKVGAVLYPLDSTEPLKISKAKIRGEVSEGMLCAEDELGLGHSHDGILVLDTDLPIGTPASTYFNLTTDYIFEIGLTPNRADAASHLGVARDLKALLKRPICIPEIDKFKTAESQKLVEIIVENSTGCPRYTGVVINNVKIKESPEWLKSRLTAIGVNPINNIVDVTNYVLHELGQPLHAFDYNKIEGNKVIIKNAIEGTKFVTLDGVERKLSSQDLVISNAKETMCLAGVFGGKDSGVSIETTSIFLESAYFAPDTVRKTAQYHGLKTDSSFRFERGTDPNMPLFALKRAALLIKEVAGGEIASMVQDIYPSKIQDFEFDVSCGSIRRLLGIKIENDEIIQILQDLGIKIINKDQDVLHLAVPPFKVDVQREADIAEEILRIVGLSKIELKPSLGANYLADFPEKDKDKLVTLLANVLADNGYNEIVTNSITKPIYAEKLNSIDDSHNIDILNRLSEDLAVMRQSMLFSGLEVILYNINRKQKDLKLFEFGKTYHHIADKYQEKNHLVLFASGNKTSESWFEKPSQVDFYEIMNVVQVILNKIKIKDIKIQPIADEMFSEGVAIIKNNKELGRVGKVHSQLLKFADIKQSVYFADLDIDLLIKSSETKLKYEEISKFPEVRRDLSLVIDKKISFAEIEEIARKAEKQLLTQINVFDVYEGDKIEEGKKSYSVSFTFQPIEKTLTDEEVDKIMQKLMQSYETITGAVIRK